LPSHPATEENQGEQGSGRGREVGREGRKERGRKGPQKVFWGSLRLCKEYTLDIAYFLSLLYFSDGRLVRQVTTLK